MEITDVRIKLVRQSKERLRAFCTVTFDNAFVVRDIKIVDGTHGLFVAMPSRKLAMPCPGCSHKNHLRARFCEMCGARLPEQQVPADDDGRAKLYTDVAHPITQAFRERLQTRIIDAYEGALDADGSDEEVVREDEVIVEVEEAEDEEVAAVEEETADEEVDEHEDLDDSDTSAGTYRSLIADLRGDRPSDRGDRTDRGGGPAGQDPRPRPPADRTDESRPRRGRSRGRGRRDRQEGSDGQQGGDRDKPPREHTAGPTAPKAKQVSEVVPVRTATPADTVRASAPPPPKPARAPEPARPPRAAEPKPAPPVEEPDDGSPFGAGIA